jgi:hypothetical protein
MFAIPPGSDFHLSLLCIPALLFDGPFLIVLDTRPILSALFGAGRKGVRRQLRQDRVGALFFDDPLRGRPLPVFDVRSVKLPPTSPTPVDLLCSAGYTSGKMIDDDPSRLL